METTESLDCGYGGWCRWQSSEAPGPVFVRFADVAGRLVIVDLFLPSDGKPIDSNSLRRVPLARIEQWVSVPEYAKTVRGKLNFPAPDLRTAAAYFQTSFGSAAPAHWVRDMFFSQFDAWDGPRPDPVPLSDPLPTLKRRPLDKKALKIKVPAARPFGDDFYRRVAGAWRAATDAGVRAPAEVMSDINGVQPSQVHRWVKVARSKGFLERGRVGKA
jgi:hypothetical protein